MSHILVQLMSQLTRLTEEEESAIEKSFPIRTFEKGTYLLKEGQIAKDAYYVISGCIREYELLDGDEKTTSFFTEDQSVANFYSMANQAPSRVNFVCAEDTTVAVLNAEKESELYRKFPRFETFCRTGMEQMMGTRQEQLADLITLKPEQRYRKLLEQRPELLNRVPQYHLASYLGIQPETLSRIRKRIVKS
ncbi:MAG: Crp/Fnr family transcriptional regulator [Saprospiraceae bacterium]|nr:Crp/Fnr family transcriptional regulator [Lewinella sp.]